MVCVELAISQERVPDIGTLRDSLTHKHSFPSSQKSVTESWRLAPTPHRLAARTPTDPALQRTKSKPVGRQCQGTVSGESPTRRW